MTNPRLSDDYLKLENKYNELLKRVKHIIAYTEFKGGVSEKYINEQLKEVLNIKPNNQPQQEKKS